MVNSITQTEAVAIVEELKGALACSYLAADKKSTSLNSLAADIKAVCNQLPRGTSFVVRNSHNSELPICGWLNDRPLTKVVQRGGLNEPQHTFHGVAFEFDAENRLSLLAGWQAHQPWCRLLFNKESGEPAFELGVILPDQTAREAIYS